MICLHCQREFRPKHANQKCCHRSCKNMYAYLNKKGETAPSSCPQCGKAFFKIRPHHYFCSSKCRVTTYIQRRDGQRLQRVSGTQEKNPAEFIARMQARHDEILASRMEVQKWPAGPGIYFLILREKVVYVGQSVSLASRLAGHISSLARGQKDFDSFSWIECSREDLNFFERIFQVIYDSTIAYGCDGKPADSLRGQADNALRMIPGCVVEVVA